MPPISRGSKLFHHRSSTSNLITPICCLLAGIAGLIFGIIAVTTVPREHSCTWRQPRSVSVVWDRITIDGGPDSQLNNERHKVKGFVGIFTGFSSVGRRRSLRQTWMPSHKQSLEEATGLTFRFVIGRTVEMWKMSHLQKEIAEYDDFLLLDIEEEYNKLPYKTLAFFKAAYSLFDSEFYVKVDDDIYLRPDQLSLLLAKERSNPQTYIGCMKKGPVFKDPNLKWHEPLSYLLGSEYFLHAYGPIYALSASVVRSLGALGNDSFRMFSSEDVTIGSWMVAMNVNFENNKALCEPSCTPTAIAVWDIPQCSGLCNPETKMLELHRMEACFGTPQPLDLSI